MPALVPKTYYGMPAYATEGKNGKVIGFFKPKSKFKVRYSTFGFQPDAKLDDGEMWPTEFAVIELTPAVEKRIADLDQESRGLSRWRTATGARSRSAAPARTTSATSASTSRSAG